VGAAPVDVQRPAGVYRVVVQRAGFNTYQTQVAVRAGEETNLRAALDEKKPSLLRRWWFWTAAGVVVAGVAVGAYFGATANQTPKVDGGGLGWAVQLRH
jgi:hypothetical protein